MPIATTPAGASPAPIAHDPGAGLHRLHCEVRSVSRPVPGAENHVFVCDAVIRVAEGEDTTSFRARLSVHHPRGWMGVITAFDYECGDEDLPTFQERAAWACRRVLDEFPADAIVSVFLLGTGDTRLSEGSAGHS